MSKLKNEKTKIFIGSSTPDTADLAAAEEAVTAGFGCTVITMNGLGLSRSTTSDDSVYCSEAGGLNADDTDELKVSNFTMTAYVDEDSADYNAAAELSKTMIVNDIQGTFMLTEPNEEDSIWMEMKVIKWEIERGGAKDKRKLSIELVPRTMPKDV